MEIIIWLNQNNCLRQKENVGWTIPHLTQSLLRLKRPRINQTIQVLTGHWNLQKHKKTTGRDVSSLFPKCNLADETPNHHVGEYSCCNDLRKKVFDNEKTTTKMVVNKLNITKLASYLQQAGRLAEYFQ